MSIKLLSSIKHQNYTKSVLQLITGIAFALIFSAVSAADVAEDVDAPSEISSSPTKKPDNFLKGDAPLGGPSVLDSTGIIQGTDFSKEIGFSRQGQPLEQAGFSKKIVLTTGVAYDSNPALDDNRKRSVWIYSLTPQLLLDYTGEVNNLYLDAALQVQRNSNEEILADRDDPQLGVGWSRTYASGVYGIYADYSQFASRAAELTATGVFAGNPDGESTQRDRTFGGRWQHEIAPRWSVLTSGEYQKTAYSGGVGLVDFGLVDVRSRLNYEYTERLDTYLQLGYAELRPDDTFEDTELTRLAVGANYQLSEALKVSSRAGMYHSTGPQSDTDWEAGVQLGYEAGRMRYVAELNRELAATALGAFQKSDTFRLGWLFDKSEIDRFSVNYTLIKFKEDEVGLLTESKYQEISALYDRILGGNWRGQANLIFREQDGTGGSGGNGNIVGVRLIYDGLSF